MIVYYFDQRRQQSDCNVRLLMLSTEELSDGNKREHLQAVLAVGKFVLENAWSCS